MAAKVAAPHPVGIDANLEEREVIKQVEQEEMAEKVEKNKNLIAKRNNSPKPLAPSKGAIRTAAGFMLVHQDRVDREDGVQEKKTKKRKLSERLEEPIEVKTGGRHSSYYSINGGKVDLINQLPACASPFLFMTEATSMPWIGINSVFGIKDSLHCGLEH